MAEPLKHQFGPAVVHRIAREIAVVWPPFRVNAFTADALKGFDALELMPRGLHIATALRAHLPAEPEQAIDVIVSSLGATSETTAPEGGMASFFYLPHVSFVAEYGLDCFEASMGAQYELTQRFTAEFSIRAFLERHEAATLARLGAWAADPSPHVRRLVSEGTRPRLPWARRLRRFQTDPAPVLALLERLKDDPSEYVRRSVANNLNDIGKDHPDVLIRTGRSWMKGADENRRALVAHALRSLVKAGDSRALSILGYGHVSPARVVGVTIAPRRPHIGDEVRLAIEVANPGKAVAHALVDLRVHFVKAGGRSTPKVFKLGIFQIERAAPVTVRKTLSLAQLTTRRHYPGRHRLDVMINGRSTPIGFFDLVGSRKMRA